MAASAGGDLPSDFPVNEVNMLGPVIHLLLDKAEEIRYVTRFKRPRNWKNLVLERSLIQLEKMARQNELPPQYPNDEDKYDKELWSLEANKEDHIITGIEVEKQREMPSSGKRTPLTKISVSPSISPNQQEPDKSTPVTNQSSPEINENMKAESVPAEKAELKQAVTGKAENEECTQTEKSPINRASDGANKQADNKEEVAKSVEIKKQDQQSPIEKQSPVVPPNLSPAVEQGNMEKTYCAVPYESDAPEKSKLLPKKKRSRKKKRARRSRKYWIGSVSSQHPEILF
ncbi:unnamed protein product [Anisakis simplex]|uniref:PHD finger protein 10 n=1 Tax=Anisakis simplex TaxID=6269 RepID=A0A0M3J4I7_ANISI|nr:unnamed protein product [Anisakis simplex]